MGLMERMSEEKDEYRFEMEQAKEAMNDREVGLLGMARAANNYDRLKNLREKKGLYD